VSSVRFTPARWLAVVAIGSVLAIVSFLLAVSFGEQPLTLENINQAGSTDETIFFALRLPRVVLAALVGAALATSGSMLQALLRNPLADPFVLGVSGGAALGATIALALGLTSFVIVPGLSTSTVFALLGSVLATVLVLVVGRLAGGNLAHSTLLAGIIFNSFALAAITFIKALVAPDRLGEILFWLAGMLRHETGPTLRATALVVAGAILVMTILAPRLNLLTMGDEDAWSLGVNVKATRLVLLLAASTAVSAVVALSGLIGFVGLLVPHAIRLVLGADQRLNLPANALVGASFMMLADLGARALFAVFNTEPPVGVITALLGGPLFLVLMARDKNAARGGFSAESAL
jgi:iron complex transport system permease protein